LASCIRIEAVIEYLRFVQDALSANLSDHHFISLNLYYTMFPVRDVRA